MSDDSEEEYMARLTAFTEKYIASRLPTGRVSERPTSRLSKTRRTSSRSYTSQNETSSTRASSSRPSLPTQCPLQQMREFQQVAVPRGGSQRIDEDVGQQMPLTRRSRPLERRIHPNVRNVQNNPSRSSIHANRYPVIDMIPVEHRHIEKESVVQPRRVAEVKPVQPIKQTGNNELIRETKHPRNIEPLRVTSDQDGMLESLQRRRAGPDDMIMPILGSSAPVNDQTTWIPEQTATRSRLPPVIEPYDPNETVLASSREFNLTIEPIDPERKEYPPMFTELTREMAQQERTKRERPAGLPTLAGEFVSLRLEDAQNIPSRSTTAMSKRAPVLPPLAKGKISEPGRKTPTKLFRATTPNPPVLPVIRTSSRLEEAFESDRDLATPSPVPTPSSARSTNTQPSNNGGYDKAFLRSLTPEMLDGMTEEDALKVTDAFYYEGGPRMKFKESYPFMAEGIVQKDCETNQLKVFSSRLGRVLMDDTRIDKAHDYVYFIVIRPGVFKGFAFDMHPKSLISAKFPSLEKIVLRGYAILAHPVGQREDSVKENRWICWNDSLGLMSIISGAARIPLKKQPVWDKQLDVISIQANFENGRFVVLKVVGLTNTEEKKKKFPEEVFLVKDAIFKRQDEEDLMFFSATLNAPIFIKRTLVGEMVVVPTFPKSTCQQFRALLIINMPATFWSRDKEWIREILVKKTETYCS